MLNVGLTGGIASGKSAVLRQLAAEGLLTIDLDRVAHDVMAPGGTAYADVVGAFGPSILDAEARIVRPRLAAIVFADPGARARLDALVHPRVRAEAARRAAALAAGQPGTVVVTDAALLVEAGQHLRFDRLVVVHCSVDLQLQRLRDRDGLDEAAARARLAAQMPAADKVRFGHYRIDSSGELADTLGQARELADTLRAEAAAPRCRPVPDTVLASCLAAGPTAGPRGLHPQVLLDEAARSGLDLSGLAGRLDPPPAVPWYRAGTDVLDVPLSSLAPALVAWAGAQRDADPAVLLAGAHAVAVLLSRDPGAQAQLCFAALSLLEAVSGWRCSDHWRSEVLRRCGVEGRPGPAAPSPVFPAASDEGVVAEVARWLEPVQRLRALRPPR